MKTQTKEKENMIEKLANELSDSWIGLLSSKTSFAEAHRLEVVAKAKDLGIFDEVYARACELFPRAS